jgi:sec-independent protein translocase protein TatA
MGELQPTHLLLVLLVVLVLFGGSRLSQLGKGLGEGIRNFKKSLSDDEPLPAERHQRTSHGGGDQTSPPQQ